MKTWQHLNFVRTAVAMIFIQLRHQIDLMNLQFRCGLKLLLCNNSNLVFCTLLKQQFRQNTGVGSVSKGIIQIVWYVNGKNRKQVCKAEIAGAIKAIWQQKTIFLDSNYIPSISLILNFQWVHSSKESVLILLVCARSKSSHTKT